MAGESTRRAVPQLEDLVRDVPDFPTAGVVYKDITPLLADPVAMASAVDAMAAPWLGSDVDFVVGLEARGFILAAPVARVLAAGFVPARKPGKLPLATFSEPYGLEYGHDSLEIHTDSLPVGSRVVIIDDVLATGGTAAAAARLVSASNADLLGFGFLIELPFLGGRSRLAGSEAHAVMALGAREGDD